MKKLLIAVVFLVGVGGANGEVFIQGLKVSAKLEARMRFVPHLDRLPVFVIHLLQEGGRVEHYRAGSTLTKITEIPSSGNDSALAPGHVREFNLSVSLPGRPSNRIGWRFEVWSGGRLLKFRESGATIQHKGRVYKSGWHKIGLK